MLTALQPPFTQAYHQGATRITGDTGLVISLGAWRRNWMGDCPTVDTDGAYSRAVPSDGTLDNGPKTTDPSLGLRSTTSSRCNCSVRYAVRRELDSGMVGSGGDVGGGSASRLKGCGIASDGTGESGPKTIDADSGLVGFCSVTSSFWSCAFRNAWRMTPENEDADIGRGGSEDPRGG
jgi:hypothetical protein